MGLIEHIGQAHVFLIIESEFFGKVIRDIIRHVEIQRVPQQFHLSPVFLGRSTAARVAFEEKCLHRMPELVEFLLWSYVFGIFGNKPGSYTFFYCCNDSVGIQYGTLADSDYVARLYCPGRLDVITVETDFPSLACVRSIAPCLEYAD